MESASSAQPFRWRPALAWALYDFANTAFAVVVLAFVWPMMFHGFWGKTLEPQMESVAFKFTQALPCLVIFFLAPFLGQLAEVRRVRARAFKVAVVVGALFTAGLGWVGEGDWLASAWLYTLGAIAYFCAGTFYDSMIVDAAPPSRRHQLSGSAFALGFIAGFLILVALGLGFFDGPAIRWIYPAAGLWWLVFSLPLLWQSTADAEAVPSVGLREAMRGVLATGKELWADRRVRWFLVAYILYIDGVHAVKTSAAHFGAVLGFGQADLVKAFLVVQVIGVPAALAFGWLGARVGAVRMIAVALVGYIILTLLGSRISPGDVTLLGWSFPSVWLIAFGVGLVQGGVQALSRSYFAELVPAGREVAYFGFYSMMGKFAAFLGPLLGAAAGLLFATKGDPTSAERVGFASFALLFLLGLALLFKSRRGNA